MTVTPAMAAQALVQRALLSVGSPGASTVRRPFTALDAAQLAELHGFAARMREQQPTQASLGPASPDRATILARAQGMLGVPYRWGGNSMEGMDCSAFVSRAWGIGRHTTDTLPSVAHEISKDELQPGDALNLPTWRDRGRAGHVRLFAGWADAARTKMHVYEEVARPGRAVRHVIPYDPAYTPLRLTKLAATAS